MSAVNLAVGQSLLESFDAFVGYLGAGEIQVLELRQSLKVFQPRVSDLRPIE